MARPTQRISFPSLEISDFIHPREAEFNSNSQLKGFSGLIDTANALCVSIMETLVKGTFVMATPETQPRVYDILRNVMRILNYKGLPPTIFISHKMLSDVSPCGTDSQYYITVPDYVLKTFDDDMLYYALGNAVSMLKAGHVKHATIAAFIPGNAWTFALKKPFLDLIHAADATSDRGGLLACQSFAAAVRCQLVELGMPAEQTRTLFTSDEEAELFVSDYLDAVNLRRNENNITSIKLVRIWRDTMFIEAAGNTMLEELWLWYRSEDGYKSLLQKNIGNGR